MSKDGQIDWETLGQTVRYAVRFLDDIGGAERVQLTLEEVENILLGT